MPPPQVVIAYSTYGTLNAAGDNGVNVGHSLTSNSNVHEWWAKMMGEGPRFCINLQEDFVVCCNYLGSPYGSASPVTPDPSKADGELYGADFPKFTLRDQVSGWVIACEVSQCETLKSLRHRTARTERSQRRMLLRY
jgi:homoserine acetyltransferase